MLARMSIATKLGVAYILFLLPILYLGTRMVSDKETNVVFAQKEVQGVRYISTVLAVQNAVVRGAVLDGLPDRITANEKQWGGNLATSGAAETLVSALAHADRGAAARAAADLAGKAADGSNLTLDPDLDSFYAQDALTTKIPTVVAAFTSLMTTVSATAKRTLLPADQVDIGVQVGSLQPALDGLASDIKSASDNNPDRTVADAVPPAVAVVLAAATPALVSLADHARAADAHAIVLPVLGAIQIAAETDEKELEHLLHARIAKLRSAEFSALAIAALLFVAAVLYVLVVVQRGIVKPLKGLTVGMRKLAIRDFTVDLGTSARKDEIGAMTQAVQVFKDGMIAADRLAAEQQAEQVARLERSGRIEGLIGSFEAQVGGTVSALASASTEMEATARSMTGAASQTDTQAIAVARAAEESSIGMQTVASAAEELAFSISEINQQVAISAALTDRVVGSVRDTDRVVAVLAENVGRIGDVVTLINSIAGQTNLLALNATIEAARAGEAGRGFAVVASEVKSLAQQTARATEEVRGQIDQVQAATNSAVEAIKTIAGMIEEVGTITTSIAAAVEEQGAATAEIARSVQQTSTNTQTVTTNIAGVSRTANDTGTAAAQVLSSAGDLSCQAENLSREVSSFIAGVRTA